MMKKERLYVFLCVLILVFCAACGKTDEEDGTIKKITASTTSYEHFENPYNAEYYYENNQAFFIFLYNGGEEHRIYLDKNDPMRCVRHIDADGMIYDYPAEEEGSENFLAEQYSVLAMQELHWAGI